MRMFGIQSVNSSDYG